MTKARRAGFLLSCLTILGSGAAVANAKEAFVSAGSRSAKPSIARKSTQNLVSVLDDNVEYSMDSIQKSKYLGQMSKGRTAGNDALFYIVRLHAKNIGDNERTVLTDNFMVQTANGEHYGPSREGKTAVLINGGTNDLFGSRLQPSVSKPFLVIFDIPIRSVDSGADLIVPSSKPGSTDRCVIRLDNSKNQIRGSISGQTSGRPSKVIPQTGARNVRR